MMTEICGMTPEARTLRSKMRPYPSSETTPSWIRAPPESLRPISGAPTSSARSMTLVILSATTSPRLPPKTVKSSANRNTLRPSTVPQPVMTASPSGRLVFDAEAGRLMAHQGVDLLEGALVDQHLDALACRLLAAFMLAIDGPLVGGGVFCAQRFEAPDAIVCAHMLCP